VTLDLWTTLIPIAIATTLMPVELTFTQLMLRAPGGRARAGAWIAGKTVASRGDDDNDHEAGHDDQGVRGEPRKPGYGHPAAPRQPECLGHGGVAEHQVDELLGERSHRAREDDRTGEPSED